MVSRSLLLTFPLEINSTLYDANEKTMSYTDLIIFKEHKFLANVFSNEELTKTDSMKDVKTYHQNFARFLKIVVFLQNAFNTCNEFEERFKNDLLDFCRLF